MILAENNLAERELRSLLVIARKISFGSQSKTGLKEAFGCSWDDLLDGCGSKVVKERIVLFRK